MFLNCILNRIQNCILNFDVILYVTLNVTLNVILNAIYNVILNAEVFTVSLFHSTKNTMEQLTQSPGNMSGIGFL